MTSSLFLLLIGTVLLIGVAGNKLFHVTRIPNSLILMVTGIVLGPGLGWVQIPNVSSVALLIGTLALVLILFEGGLELDLQRVAKVLFKSVQLGFFTFLLSAVCVFLVAWAIFPFTAYEALLMGLILGGTSPSVILPLLRRMSLDEETSTVLTLECTVSELCTVVSMLIAISVAQSAHSVRGLQLTLTIVRHVVYAILIAAAAGLLWGRISNWMKGVSLSYMLTLAFICLLYSGVHELGGDGALAVLFFGIVLANAHVVVNVANPAQKLFRLPTVKFDSGKFVADEFLGIFNAELSFFVRTIFFLLLGLMLEVRSWNASLIVKQVLLLVALVLARLFAVAATGGRSKSHGAPRRLVVSFVPRGLVSASMALLALDAGLFGAAENNSLVPIVLQSVFGVILLTNVTMALALQFRGVRARPSIQVEAAQPAAIPAPDSEDVTKSAL